MTRWRLQVLGGVSLYRGEHAHGLERKSAALLAYLALEGASPRSRLAGLLWPDSPEQTARNNLRQAARRLRQMTGIEVVSGSDPMTLCPDLEVDAACLQEAAFLGHHAKAAALEGDLLSCYDYDDCLELEDWLLAERERLTNLRRNAAAAEATRLEQAGDYRAALDWAERLLRAEPVSEEAHRRLMRLHYLRGDRAAALQAFENCELTLQRELGVAPLEETLALAGEIERGLLTPKPSAPRQRYIPLSLQRPPLLAGRERAWAQLEAAWDAGQTIFIGGRPGVGKSRLAFDFAASKGNWHPFEARPGDPGVPFAYFARVWRKCLQLHPGLALEPWVRQELSRLAPELSDEPLPPLRSDEERLRLYQALAMLMWSALQQDPQIAVIDDLHYIDEASAEAWKYLTSEQLEAQAVDAAPVIYTFRQDELPAIVEDHMGQLVGCGSAALIEVESLDEAAVAALVASLDLQGLSDADSLHLGRQLHRYTGGNPLFVIETLKSLIESGGLERGLPTSFPAPGRVSTLIQRRLERLSPPALHLLQMAAVAQEDLDVELASEVLDAGPLELAESWHELEAAQMLSGDGFSHDLLYETTLRGIPEPVKGLLHRRIARCLMARGANPVRIAQHWLQAGNEKEAAPFLLQAAETAKAGFRFKEAADFFERAGNIFDAQGDAEQAFEAFLTETEMLLGFDHGSRHETLLDRLLELAKTPAQKAYAWHARAHLLEKLGRGSESEQATRTGYDCALAAGDRRLQTRLLNDLAAALWAQGRVSEAATTFQMVIATYEELADEQELVYTLNNLGVALNYLDRYEEAETYFRRSEELSTKLGNTSLRVVTLTQLGNTYYEKGLVQDALDVLQQAQELSEDLVDNITRKVQPLLDLGNNLRSAACYTKALDCLRQASSLACNVHGVVNPLPTYLGQTLSVLGQFERADARLAEALEQEGFRTLWRGKMWLARANNCILHEQPAHHALEQAERILTSCGRKLNLGELSLAKATTLLPERGLTLSQEVLETARALGLGGLQLAAETRCAQALLTLECLPEARQHIERAEGLLETYGSTVLYHAEVLFTLYRVLDALEDPAAPRRLQACVDWILTVVDRNVPSEYRQSFLERNPVNRAVLELAQRADIALS